MAVDREAERVRLFAALELPPVVRATLVRWREEQLGSVSRLRLSDPAWLHATLCFLGSRPRQDVAPIVAACQTLASQPRVVLSLGGVLWLPSRRPRTLAIRLEDAQGRLSRLQCRLGQALLAGGWYELPRRPFLGHVTLARMGMGADRRPLEVAPPDPLRFSGTTVSLFRSHLQAAGARYERLASVQLSG